MAILPMSLMAASSLTIFNQNIGLVREVLPLTLNAGENVLIHTPVASGIDPNSILLHPETKGSFKILEQGFEPNRPSRDTLLKKFEGEKVQFLVTEAGQPDRILNARILTANGEGSIVEIDDTIRFGLPGQPIFPRFPNGTRLQPAIVWTLAAEHPTTTSASATYLTSGLDWTADYTLVSGLDGESVNITAMVAITNQTSRDFEGSHIKLMAGKISLARPEGQFRENSRVMAMAAADSTASQIEERSFADMHLYTIGRPVTLRSGEMKQVEFATATGVRAHRIYIYDAQAEFIPIHMGGDPLQRLTNKEFGSRAGTRVDVFREFENTKKNSLGIPLPAGTFRFYEKDGSELEFIGEQRITHTPPGETVRVATGAAFDLIGKRIRQDFVFDHATKTTTEQIEITLHNRKDSDVFIHVIEHLSRGTNWEILKSNMKFERLDSNRIQFVVPVPAGVKKSVTYTVRYSC
jgi:hypothetical protein